MVSEKYQPTWGPISTEKDGQREQVRTQISDERRSPFRQRDMKHGSYRAIVDISTNILNFAGASPNLTEASLCEGH